MIRFDTEQRRVLRAWRKCASRYAAPLCHRHSTAECDIVCLAVYAKIDRPTNEREPWMVVGINMDTATRNRMVDAACHYVMQGIREGNPPATCIHEQPCPFVKEDAA